MSRFHYLRSVTVAVVVCLAGCAGQSTQPTAGQRDLAEGIGLYEQGDFQNAIRKLTSSAEIWSADASTQTQALKYLAFSYCVTRKASLCRQQFDKALKLDPAFDLAPTEKGHPMWGPVFDQARRSQQQGQNSPGK